MANLLSEKALKNS